MPSQIDIWKTFIEAEKILLDAATTPFYLETDTLKWLDNTICKVKVNSKVLTETVEKIINSAFPDILHSNIDWERGVISKPKKIQVSKRQLQKAKEKGASHHLYLSSEPSINFEISHDKTERQVFLELINRIPDSDKKKILLTEKEIGKLINSSNEIISLNPPFGAVFSVKPSEYYLESSKLNLEKSLKNFTKTIKHDLAANSLSIYNSFVPIEKIEEVENNLPFTVGDIEIAVRIENFPWEEERWRRSLGVFYKGEEAIINPIVILPPPVNRSFRYFLKKQSSKTELYMMIRQLGIIYETCFGKSNISIQYRYSFKANPMEWARNVHEKLSGTEVVYNPSGNLVSFDFENINQLRKLKKQLQSLDILTIDDNGEEHLYKVEHEFKNPLRAINESLKKQMGFLDIHYSRNREKLICSYFYPTGNDAEKLIAESKIREIIKTFNYSGFKVENPKIEVGFEQYSFYFSEREAIEELEKNLLRIKNEEIGFRDEKKFDAFGKIEKVKFPYITFKVKKGINPPNLNQKIFGNLKGEEDKIKRLADTVNRIYDKKEDSCVNPLIKILMRESSYLPTIDNIENSLKFTAKLEEVSDSRLNQYLNPSQLKAITKSLLAQDIFVIQGPPGTGKSTGISEIIWQHLKADHRKRILVTSETNLAVDNALDKLRSKHHNLIKPVRFGDRVFEKDGVKIYKLDKEGRRFSMNLIEDWVKGISNIQEEGASLHDSEVSDANEIDNPNVVQDWMFRISKYAGTVETEENDTELILKWKQAMGTPSVHTKSIFYKNYKKNINVIGAASSSIGKTSSTNKFTGFYLDYSKVFLPNAFEKYQEGLDIGNKRLIAQGAKEMDSKNIYFDLIIQDEASKATPPELALPMVYAKKSIIIGDHRQLPPMVDTNEFIENLESIEGRADSREERVRVRKLIEQIRSNRDEFDISHFERIFKGVPNALKAAFNTQYRMHPSINDAICQFYPTNEEEGEFGLLCGLAPEHIDSKDLTNPQSRYHGITIPGFMDIDDHIIWVDTNSPELKVGTSRSNQGEVEVIEKIISAFNSNPSFDKFLNSWNDVEDQQIGIISFYGAQLSQLNKLKDQYPKVPMRISTVDKFQGMERNILIVSTVRSNKLASYENQEPEKCDTQNSLGFAEFPNRLNVALSRAKRLLIIVGNKTHFCQKDIYQNVVKSIEKSQNGKVITAEKLLQKT